MTFSGLSDNRFYHGSVYIYLHYLIIKKRIPLYDSLRSNNVKSEYVLNHGRNETERLILQSSIAKPVTTRLLLSAGIKPGMRVLDLGCGPGDVTLLAAELVGQHGTVTGIDRERSIIPLAQARAEQIGLHNITFMHHSLDTLTDERGFDMVIGRYVIVHQSDPVNFLRQSSRLLRPKGVLAFHEIDTTRQAFCFPSLPLFSILSNHIVSAVTIGLADKDIAHRLGNLFDEAGLPFPQIFCETPAECTRTTTITRCLAELFKTLYPDITELTLPDGRVIPAELITEEAIQEVTENNAQVEYIPQICVWTSISH